MIKGVIMATRAEKLTISLPGDILKLADEIAAEKKISRSKLVYLCLRELAEKRVQLKMAEGYRALAGDSRDFADQAIHAASEVIFSKE
jgi:metal-responsive CopG/Arc/MetJ family transcriptional regulator